MVFSEWNVWLGYSKHLSWSKKYFSSRSCLVVSRYRRKEANARERQRQGEINTGFDKLREKIPHPGPSNGKCEKLRKIDILHVAIEYIRYNCNITIEVCTDCSLYSILWRRPKYLGSFDQNFLFGGLFRHLLWGGLGFLWRGGSLLVTLAIL